MNYNDISEYLFGDDEIMAMNAAYNVGDSWPGYQLIGLDGGGNGLFIKINRDGIVYRMQMGCPNEPEYFCDSVYDVDKSIVMDMRVMENERPQLYDLTINVNSNDAIMLIRAIQRAFGMSIDSVGSIKNRIGTEFRIPVGAQKCVMDKITKDISGGQHLVSLISR